MNLALFTINRSHGMRKKTSIEGSTVFCFFNDCLQDKITPCCTLSTLYEVSRKKKKQKNYTIGVTEASEGWVCQTLLIPLIS